MFKIDPIKMYKFGKTSSEDILERFDPEVHYRENWRATPLGRDYNIKPIWSMWVTKERAIKAEQWFEKTYTKKFFSATDYNGITECRNWTEEEHRAFTKFIYARYRKTEEYWKEVAQLKAQGKLGKTHKKIYYIMLTKKQ